MRSVNNINTLKALMRDEHMASKDYIELSRDKDVLPEMRVILEQMSEDEKRHHANLKSYYDYLTR